VEYGTTTAYGSSAGNPQLKMNHSISISGLSADTTYHYRLRSAINSGLKTTSADYTFRTLYVYVSNETNITANETTTIEVPKSNLTIDIMTTEDVQNPAITVGSTTSSPVSEALGVPGLNRYIQINASEELKSAIKSVLLKMYYTDAEVAAAGLNETSLAMYWYDASSQEWMKLNTSMPWVYATGVNTTGNYVWANVSHFSEYTVGGNAITCTLKGDYAPCGTVSLQEVIDLINLWVGKQATLSQVVALINSWAHA